MASPLSTRLADSIPVASASYHKLVLAVGPARTGKTGALAQLADAKGRGKSLNKIRVVVE